jgi:hypothetical protein
MITSIITYGSEIWIADHKINIENLHNLSFEKTQNMIMKQINKYALLSVFAFLSVLERIITFFSLYLC